MATLAEIEKMSDVEIQEYALSMMHTDGTKESEMVYQRLAEQMVAV